MDPLVYFDNQEKLDEASRFRKVLMITNALVVTLILTFTVFIEVGYQDGTEDGTNGNVMYWIGEYGSISLEAIFAIVWGITLVKLLHKVRNTPNLLPNRNIFI